MNDFEKVHVDDITVIVVNTIKCSLYHQKYFKRMIDEELKSGQRKFIIDLNSCESIDSYFEAAIIGTAYKISGNDCELKIVKPEKISEDFFTKTDARCLFGFYKTNVDAIKSFMEDIQIES